MMKRERFLLGCAGVFVLVLIGTGRAESVEKIQRRFVELPPESRRLVGPLFWLHGDESRERLQTYIEKIAEGGNGSFTAESRPHSDWLGEGWYRDLGICLESAKKHDLKMWIFDEKWWPSGEVGGKVPQAYGSKYMQALAVDVQGPQKLIRPVSSDKLIAVLAGKVVQQGIDGDSLRDVTENLREGTLTWDVPQGQWKVLIFTWQYSKGCRGGTLLVDGASRDAVDWYIKTVYQPHYDRFKKDFGTSIPGFFYDEPETPGDWGTEVIPLLKERGVDWKKALTAWKFTLAGDEQTAAKYQYQDAFAEAWGRTLFGGLTQWCHDHKVQSIGHFLEHSKEYLDPKLSAGNMFQLEKYSDMGGIDAVFDQFVMGKRAAANSPTWQTPKLGSSISHVYGKTDDIAMVEIFGARGQDLTYPEMKWWTDHMFVSGINFHIPHSFNPRAPYDTDCPPYFYNGGFEPRWPLYRVYADYTSRLSLMLSGGHHVCPVALLYLGNSYHVGKAVTPEQISESLQDALYDCDWMPYDVFEKNVRLEQREMTLYKERYQVLIVPPVEVIPYETLAKVRRFFESGGVVLGYGFLPTKSADLGKTSLEIADLCKAIWGEAAPGLGVCKTSPAGGRSYLLGQEPTPQQIQQVLGGDAGVPPVLEVLEGKTDNWLHVLHRVRDGRDLFFICNQNIDPNPRTFRFRVTAEGFPERWDPMRSEITAVPFVRHGDSVEMTMTFEPSESILLVFADTKRTLPRHMETDGTKPIRVLDVVRSGKALPAETAIHAGPDGPDPLGGCVWIWYPGENAAVSASPGTCYFRASFDVPPGRKVSKARFAGTADNAMSVFINGRAISDNQDAFGDWRRVADVNIVPVIRQGRNTAAISVLNATAQPSPAGLIGKFELGFDDGSGMTVMIDQTWKTANRQQDGWEKSDFDDSQWTNAVSAAAYGSGPWGTPGKPVRTISPVARADSFEGSFELPVEVEKNKMRVVLQLGGLKPETAARITLNEVFAGGFIGNPLRKDITQQVRTGVNTVRIDPFCPEQIQVLLCPR
jgi:hypothetical protein